MNVEVNSEFNEYAPVLTHGGKVLYFVGRRDNTTGGLKNPDDEQYFEDIYQAKWDDMDEYSEAAFESLVEMQPKIQSIMVNATIKSMGNEEFDLSKINNKLKKIATYVIEDLFENWS